MKEAKAEIKVKGLSGNIITLVALRSLFFSFLIHVLDENIDLGTSPMLLSVGAIVGVALSSRLAFTRLNSIGFFLLMFIAYVLHKLFFYGFSLINFSASGMFFFSTVIESHASLFLLVVCFSAVSTWLFWKASFTLTLEIIILLAASINLLSGHRNFHFESPKLLNNLAWDLGMQPLTVLVILGVLILTTVMIYVYLASLTNRVHFSKRTAGGIFSMGSQSFFLNILSLGGFAVIMYVICSLLFSHYDREALSRTANGVGQEKNEGVSPLDFHSALGSTNQPSAMVRLEGDYNNNPFIPMLYMRESALSEYNGKEMVISGSYDEDVNSTSPEQVYKVEENTILKERTSLTQSMYLLSEHKLAFATDYPLEIKQLKNPNPKRFKAVYRAVSMVPAFKLEDIKNAELGEETWSQETWKHYLETTKDARYSELAMKISDSYSSSAPLTTEKAFKVINYLNKNAIYTLTPNHEVKTGEDPVAPFLFGDMRGYCVHFAHATVYMLRSLGIPSRIATGYLTDLSQARDGHILLRMSDRHAWAEVYVRGKGWIPFDTQPEKVESHAESQVDLKLLEELMGMLEPGEEILPDKTLDNEANVHEESKNWKPDPVYVLAIGGGILALLALIKLYMRFGWYFKSDSQKKLRASYLALASKLCDLGLKRLPAETRSEFRQRITRDLQLQVLEIPHSLNIMNYAGSYEGNNTAINEIRKNDMRSLSRLTFKQKIKSFLNPSSVLAFLSGHKW